MKHPKLGFDIWNKKATVMLEWGTKVKIDGKLVHAVVIGKDNVYVEFNDCISNIAASVVEEYGEFKVWIPMGAGDKPSQWWSAGTRPHTDIKQWLQFKEADMPKEIQLWIELLQ